MSRLHKLKKEWKSYLIAASYLENTGAAISALHHAQHSYYIAQNFDFPWLDDHARKYVAHMCLWHSEGKVNAKALTFLKSGNEKAAFLKTLAILRIANALVWHNRSSVSVSRVGFTKNTIDLKVAANGSRELVKLRLEARKKLFERVFKKRLIVKT